MRMRWVDGIRVALVCLGLGAVGCADSGEPRTVRGADAATKAAEDAAVPASSGEAECGDYICVEEAEDCRSCALDCGECPTCSLAPTCTGAAAVPTGSMRLERFDNAGQNLYESGVEEDFEMDMSCRIPELRMRLRLLHVVDDDDGLFGGSADLFCAITATDGTHSELFLSSLQLDLNDDEEAVFSPTESLFWGQMGLQPTTANLTITYQCFQASSDQFSRILEGVEDAALGAAGTPGVGGSGSGWVFAAGGIAAGVIADAVRDSDPDPWLNVQQTIDRRALYELTNGRIWRIDGDLDGELWIEVESWGCAEVYPFE